MLPGLDSLPLDAPLPEYPDHALERMLASAGYSAIAGVDEVGRGCLAGPVVAAAAILPPDFRFPGLTDSKQMTEDARDEAEAFLKQEVVWGVGICSPQEIDRWNILRASLEAMKRALTALSEAPDFVLVDGNQQLPAWQSPQQTVIKGDARSISIAAASVLAKVERDRIMYALDQEHPDFGWASNVGYPTTDHFDALARLGPTVHHRRTFRLRIADKSQTSLF
ncbi:MAG: ribonuclease HII [Rhodothermales bacterium]|jgi:ribonuclease HII